MIKCPDCKIKLSPYCTKITKEKIKKRYYKCPICSKTYITTVIETEKIEKENKKKADHKIHLPSTSRVYHGLLKNFKLFFKEVF